MDLSLLQYFSLLIHWVIKGFIRLERIMDITFVITQIKDISLYGLNNWLSPPLNSKIIMAFLCENVSFPISRLFLIILQNGSLIM